MTQGWDWPRDPAYALVTVATGRTVVRKARCEIGPGCPIAAGTVWSPDGREVAYATTTGIGRARPTLSGARYVLETATPPLLQHWTHEGLLAIDWPNSKVVTINPVTRSTRTIHSSPRGWQAVAVAVGSG